MIPIIDTHQHLWDSTRFQLPWLSSVPQLNRSFLMSDYLDAAKDQEVVKTIYMEIDVAEQQRLQEIDYVTALCEDDANPMQGAVASGDPASPQFGDYTDKLAANPFLKGVRRVLHVPEMPPGTCIQDDFVRGVRLLGKQGLCFDVCIRPEELPHAVVLAGKCPDTTLIIDHCGNADPYVVSGASDPGPRTAGDDARHTGPGWREAMGELADKPNTICKISGIVARAKESWTPDDLAPTVNACIDAFGEDRVVFGGDWPVCTLGASFAQWADALRGIISVRPEAVQRKLLHDNAYRVYRLG